MKMDREKLHPLIYSTIDQRSNDSVLINKIKEFMLKEHGRKSSKSSA